MTQIAPKTTPLDQVFLEFQRSVSPERLTLFLNTQPDKADAMALYLWNISLCEALYHALHGFEVAFRNAMHLSLQRVFSSPFWFDDQTILSSDQQARVAQAKREITRQGQTMSAGRVVAELTFGF